MCCSASCSSRGLQEKRSTLIGETLQAVGGIGDVGLEALERIELARVGLHLFGNEALVLPRQRLEGLPVQPLFRDLADVGQVLGPKCWNREQPRPQRLRRIVETKERIE